MLAAITCTTLSAMESLGARIEWILKHCTKSDGTPWLKHELSLAAGLSRSYVGQLQNGRRANPEIDTLAKLARVAGVSPAWLAYGEGTPRGSSKDARRLIRFGELPNWERLCARAKERDGTLKSETFAYMAQLDVSLTRPVTPAYVAEFARVLQDHEPSLAMPGRRDGRKTG